MNFSCSDDYFYKVFIESILEMEPTYLIQDYLHQVQHIHFNHNVSNDSTSEITIQSDDIAALKEIVNEEELNNIMMHRFVDGLKKMLKNCLKSDDTRDYYKLHIRLGEYREHLLSQVQDVKRERSPELKLYEESFSDFKYDRNEAASAICRQLVDKEKLPYEENNSLNDSNYESTLQAGSKDNTLEFLTHNRNQNSQYKTKKSSWESYKAQFNRRFRNLKNDDTLQQHIKSIHNLLISSRINEAQKFKEIQDVINIDVNNIKFLQHSSQKYLKSHLWKISQYKHYNGLLSQYTHNKDVSTMLIQHNEKLKSRTNSLYSNRQLHMDKTSNKLFNAGDTLRLLLHIEMYALLNSSVRKGNLEEKDQHLIKDYIDMVEIMQKYLVYDDRTNESKLYLYMKQTVFQDLFGRTKIDAANIFTTTIDKMEGTLSTILNNSNYNFASFNIIKLLERFITVFDEFIEENEKFNNDIHTSKGFKKTDLPDLNTFKMYFNKLEKHKLSYKDFTNTHKIGVQKESLILKTFNDTNVFDERK